MKLGLLEMTELNSVTDGTGPRAVIKVLESLMRCDYIRGWLIGRDVIGGDIVSRFQEKVRRGR